MNKTIFVSFMLSVLLLTGCASQPADTMEEILTETSYEYPAEWPENRFTDCIPQPDSYTVESVRDFSAAGRYELSLSGIDRAAAHTYIRKLEQAGYSNLGGDENEHSGGVMMQRGQVVLSVSYAGENLGMLITLLDEM